MYEALDKAIKNNKKDEPADFSELGKANWGVETPQLPGGLIAPPKDLQDEYKSIGIRTSKSYWDRPAQTPKGAKDPKTIYKNVYGPGDKLILAEGNLKDKDDKTIFNWSKVTLLMWKDTVQQLNEKTKNSVQVSSLEWIFRHAITNSNTQKIVDEAYTAIDKDRSEKHVWSPKDKDVPGGGNAFYAMLGTENGKGPTRMFTDYHNALGSKRPTSITTIKTTNFFSSYTFYVNFAH